MDTMARRDKKYFVVSFLELPYPNIDSYVCVPKSWVTLRPEQQSSLVAYPNENPALTRNRIENIEPCEKHWNRYQATVKYITDLYDDADAWIATKYDDGVADQCSDAPDSHSLTNASKSFAPDNDTFDAIDRLLNIKKEEPASPPATASSTWELFSDHSPSQSSIQEETETSQNNPWPDVTNPGSEITLKRPIISNPDKNNNSKQLKLDNTASVHDNSFVPDKPTESKNNASEKDLVSYIDSFLKELQTLVTAQEVAENGNRDGVTDNNTANVIASTSMTTTATSTSSTATSQIPPNSDIVNSQKPNPPTKPLISVVSDEYLLENRSQTTRIQRKPGEIPQPNPANISAAQTLIYLNNRQKQSYQAATQSHLQLPLRKPIEDRRSEPSKPHFRKIAPRLSSPAQQSINTLELQSQQTRAKPTLPSKDVVPHSTSQIPVTPAKLTTMRNNQAPPPMSLAVNVVPQTNTSAQLSMPDIERPDSGFVDNAQPTFIAPNKPPTTQESVTPAACHNATPRSLPDNLASPETHSSRQLSMPDLQRRDSGFVDNPQPFSPSDVLFIAESPRPSSVNTEILQNQATSIGNIIRVERQPSQDPNSRAYKIQLEQGLSSQIDDKNAYKVECDQRLAIAQRPNDSTSMTNSSTLVKQSNMEPLVPVTVEELSNPENQQRAKPPQTKRGRKKNSYANAPKIENMIEQRKYSQEPIKPPPVKHECSKVASPLSDPANDNVTLLVKGYLLEDPSSGVLFVKPCPGQNILEPRRSSPNTIKEEYMEKRPKGEHRVQEHRTNMNSTSQIHNHEMIPRSHLEIGSQNVKHSMHMNSSNNRPDPQIHTQRIMSNGHQKTIAQNNRQPMDMYGSNQSPSYQINQQVNQNIINVNNQRNPHVVRNIYTNGSDPRPDGNMEPHIARRPLDMNEAHQRLDHQNSRNLMECGPRMNSQITQTPNNGTCHIPNLQMFPPNQNIPPQTQRFGKQRGYQNTQPPINPRDVSNSRPVVPTASQNIRNPLHVLNNHIQRLQAQINALTALHPNYRQIPNDCNRRPDPQMIAQNTGHMNNNNQSFGSQFIENTRQPMSGSNQRPSVQMNPQNIPHPMAGSLHRIEQTELQRTRQPLQTNSNYRCDLQMGSQTTRNHMDASNHRTDYQIAPQSTRQPMYMKNSNHRPDFQISRNPTISNQMPDPQTISQRTLGPNYLGGMYQTFDYQMQLQDTQYPMNVSNQRTDVTAMQLRLDGQTDSQNSRAQNWHPGNQI